MSSLPHGDLALSPRSQVLLFQWLDHRTEGALVVCKPLHRMPPKSPANGNRSPASPSSPSPKQMNLEVGTGNGGDRSEERWGVGPFVRIKLEGFARASGNGPQFLKFPLRFLFWVPGWLTTLVLGTEKMCLGLTPFKTPLAPLPCCLWRFWTKRLEFHFWRNHTYHPDLPTWGVWGLAGRVIHYFLRNNIPIFLPVPPPRAPHIETFCCLIRAAGRAAR